MDLDRFLRPSFFHVDLLYHLISQALPVQHGPKSKVGINMTCHFCKHEIFLIHALLISVTQHRGGMEASGRRI